MRWLQGGFCRQKHRHRNGDSKIGPGGRKPGRKPKENDPKQRKPTETQGPCPDLRGFCISALTLWCGVSQRSGSVQRARWQPRKNILFYAIVLPGRNSAFRAGFWPDCYRGKHRNRPSGRPSAGRRAVFGSFPVAVRPKIRPGRPISGPEALVRNIE